MLALLIFSNFSIEHSAFTWAEEMIQPLLLGELIEEAKRANPEILAAKHRWEAAGARPSQVSSLPDPKVMFGIKNVGTQKLTIGETPMSMANVGFSQEIPFPWKLHLRGDIAEKEAEAQGEVYQATLYRVLSRLKVAYYELFFVHKSIEIIKKDKELLEKFEKIAEVRYEVGKGIQQDVLKAQVEISRFISKLVILEQKKESLPALINSILNRPPDAPLGKPLPLEISKFTYTLTELNELALKKSPKLKAVEWMVERNSSALSLAKWEYFPDFALSGGYGYRGELEGMWNAMVGIKVPVYFFTKQRYGVKEALWGLNAARQSEEAIKQEILFRVKDLYLMTTTAERLVKLYGTGIIPQSSLSLESAISGYEVGKVDFLTLLNNLITLLNYELEYYRELVDFEKSLARLEEVVGLELTTYIR